MTSHSFHQHVRTQAASPPRTMREEEMLEIHQREVKNKSFQKQNIIHMSFQATADISIDTRHPTLQGLTFPFDENVIEALHLFKKHQVDYIQLVNFQN